MTYSSSNDEYYCHDCYENIDDNTSRSGEVRHSYSHKPNPVFYHGDGEETRDEGYGWELEVDVKDREHGTRSAANAFMNEVQALSPDQRVLYQKEDGSLSSYGSEIVSHVGTLKYWLESDTIAKVCEIAKRHHYRSHDAGSSCGFHIHASHTLFGNTNPEQELTLTKMIILIDAFWDEMIKLSRRSRQQMERWCAKYDMRSHDFQEVREKNSHHRVVAITSRTYELRMFRGSLKKESLYASMEFYMKFIEYCRYTALEELLHTSWTELREFMENDTDYLPAYFAERLDAPERTHDNE